MSTVTLRHQRSKVAGYMNEEHRGLRPQVKDEKLEVTYFTDMFKVLNQLTLSKGEKGFPDGSDGRVCLQCRRHGFVPWVGKIPWTREWLPTPILSGEFLRQRTLAG